MIEIAALASMAVSQFLVPVLKQGIGKFFSSAGEKVGDAAAKQTKSVFDSMWARVGGAFGRSGNAAVLTDFEQQPEVVAPYVELKLAELLRADPELVATLTELVERRTDADTPISHVVNNLSGQFVAQVNAEGAHLEGGSAIQGIVFGGNGPDPRRPRPAAWPGA